MTTYRLADYFTDDAPPFGEGDRVVALHHPEDGWREVEECIPVLVGRWRLRCRRGAIESEGLSCLYVRCPDDWRDAPMPPATEASTVLRRCPLDINTPGGKLWADQIFIDEARKRDLMGGVAWRVITHYRFALPRWWASYGSRINPKLADEQIAGLREMACLLEAEAKDEAKRWGIPFNSTVQTPVWQP